MPNQANKSKGQSGIVQKKKTETMPSGKQGSGNAAKNKKADTGSSTKKQNKPDPEALATADRESL